jgi:hypothetical protein
MGHEKKYIEPFIFSLLFILSSEFFIFKKKHGEDFCENVW